VTLAPDSHLQELRCASCGYGVRCRTVPERCPMCAGSVWDEAIRSLYGAEAAEADSTAPLSRELR
jgi:rubredoxin